jgi:glycosyltransferase involved in cell wall biosynthesis
MTQPMLSIIIPLHNETSRLPEAMRQLKVFRDEQYRNLDVLLMDNGSTDGTNTMIEQYMQRYAWVDGSTLKERGKGAAIALGMQCAAGDYLYMADVDFSTPLSEIPRFIVGLEKHDIVIGSREVDRRKVRASLKRRVMGRIFHQVVSRLVPGIQDTQCGYKMFERYAARDLFSRLRLAGLAFDVELLYLARRFDYSVQELPVEWRENSDSRVRLGSDSFQMLRDVLDIPKLHAKEKLPA